MSLSEAQLINKILSEKDFSPVDSNLITENNFSQFKDEYLFIKSFYDKYKCTPDKETFTSKFSNWEYFSVNEPYRAIIDSLREEELFRTAVSVINNCTDKFTKDANEGARYLLSNISKLQPSYSFNYTDIIHDNARYVEWEDKLNNRDRYFIPSGFKELDEYLFGWKRKEEFALIMARTGVGKSSFAIKSAQSIWSAGFNVAYYSPEMSPNTLGYRFDSANAAYSNTSLLHGDYINNYKEYINKLHDSENKFCVIETRDFNDNEVTVPKLKAFCKQVNADILFIDGFDYLTDVRAKKYDSREDRMGHTAQDCITLSIDMEIPVIGVIQSNRKGADKEKELDTDNITGADKIGASCTRLITLSSAGSAIKIGIPKNRYGKDRVNTIYQWDKDKSQFFYIPNMENIENNAEEKEEAEKTKQGFKNIF